MKYNFAKTYSLYNKEDLTYLILLEIKKYEKDFFKDMVNSTKYKLFFTDEKLINKSVQIDYLDLKTYKKNRTNYSTMGFYNNTDKIFTWNNSMQIPLSNIILQNFYELYGKNKACDIFVKNIFANKINVKPEDKYLIPMFIAAFLPGVRLIEIDPETKSTPSLIVFSFIELPYKSSFSDAKFKKFSENVYGFIELSNMSMKIKLSKTKKSNKK
jgi:hypothetical protein